MMENNITNLIKKYSQIEISITPIINNEDIKFVKDIKNKDDYKLYIESNTNIELSNNDYIIRYKDLSIGILELNIKKNGETLISNPNLYLTERYSYVTLFALIKILEYMFEIKKCEKVEVIVYGNNKQMLRMMDKSVFYYEGRLTNELLINNNLEDIYFYSMLESEYIKYKRDLYG